MYKLFLFVLLFCAAASVVGADSATPSLNAGNLSDLDDSDEINYLSSPSSELENLNSVTGAETDPVWEEDPTDAEDVSSGVNDAAVFPTGKEEQESTDVSIDEGGNMQVDTRSMNVLTDAENNDADEDEAGIEDDLKAMDEAPKVDPRADLQGSPLREYDITNDIRTSPLREYDIKSDLQTSPLKKYELEFSGKEAQAGMKATRDFKTYPEEGINRKFKDTKDWKVPYPKKDP